MPDMPASGDWGARSAPRLKFRYAKAARMPTTAPSRSAADHTRHQEQAGATLKPLQ